MALIRSLALCVFAVHLLAAGPGDFHLSECHVAAAMGPDRLIHGGISFILLAEKDSVAQWTFTAPRGMEIGSVVGRRQNEHEVVHHPLPEGGEEYLLLLSSPRMRTDTVFITVEFTSTPDMSSPTGTFAGTGQFLFAYDRTSGWMPFVEETSVDRATLELRIDSSFSVVSGRDRSWDVGVEAQKVFFWNYTEPVRMEEAFTLCGMSEMRSARSLSDDSLRSVTLYYADGRFDSTLAHFLVRRLTDAAGRYASITGRPEERFQSSFIFLGSDAADTGFRRSGSLFIEHNSPMYHGFDSSLATRSRYAQLFEHLADRFCPLTVDSTAVFRLGFAGYLATRYILENSRDASIERRERLDISLHALSFFPSVPLSNGDTGRPEDRMTLSYKGRYIFLMLEYILGRELFDSAAAAMVRAGTGAPMTIERCREIFERAYGTSLAWFFQEWFYRSTAPEYGMQWNARRTARGSSLVTVSIEQRGDVYTMPVELAFTFGGRTVYKRVMTELGRHDYSYIFPGEPDRVTLDPGNRVLRWLIETRILSHARSSALFRVFGRDTASSRQEAEITLALDPDNTTGAASIALYSIGVVDALRGELGAAKDRFIEAMQASSGEEAEVYSLFSLVRFANILDLEGKRADAVTLYSRAVDEAMRAPARCARVIPEAQRWLAEPFSADTADWYTY